MTDIESDRISCLPDQLIDYILSHLPIKDAGRTSVLSRKWGRKWSTQPYLLFDKQCVSTLGLEDSSIKRRKFLRIVDHATEKKTMIVTPASYCMEDIFSEPDVSLGLRYVSIEDVSGAKFELDFIKFLLLYSPLLEKMIVKPILNAKPEMMMMIELIRFKRASRHVEVIYQGIDSS
ncbi:uncharacterized protein LOC131626692 [Vicia villosa]|uniref:uncharacterized protein LOC131626692 n=1 Tax=Vicia villosa TaxID=3911 RepID=UPI00273C3B48|nr:uncharacterized protein LOC131626692 [Vicia villosa]